MGVFVSKNNDLKGCYMTSTELTEEYVLNDEQRQIFNEYIGYL